MEVDWEVVMEEEVTVADLVVVDLVVDLVADLVVVDSVVDSVADSEVVD